VLLLPYLEQQDLYKQFKLDEPWDSPNNLPLLEKMPRTYAPPRYKEHLVPPNHTICHVFVGPGTSFERGPAIRLQDGFPDGTSNTLFIVEAGEPVPWTKPEDLVYDPNGPLPQLKGLFKHGFRVSMADGSRRFFSYDIPEKSLRALITRNGGEKADW
jgi:hypothetical protein